MEVEVRLFARARELAGAEWLRIQVEDGATVGQLRSAIQEQCPALGSIVAHLHVAIGTDYADDDAILNESQSVSCFPPVSGG